MLAMASDAHVVVGRQKMRKNAALLQPYDPDTNPGSRLVQSTLKHGIRRHVLICGVGGLSPVVLDRIVSVFRSPHLGVQPTVVVLQPQGYEWDKLILRFAATLKDVWVVQVGTALLC